MRLCNSVRMDSAIVAEYCQGCSFRRMCGVQATEADRVSGSDRADCNYTRLSLSSCMQLCNSVHVVTVVSRVWLQTCVWCAGYRGRAGSGGRLG